MRKLTMLLFLCLLGATTAMAQLTVTGGGAWQAWQGGAAPGAGWQNNCNAANWGAPVLGTHNRWQENQLNPQFGIPATGFPGSNLQGVTPNYIWVPNQIAGGPANGGRDVGFFRLCVNIDQINGCDSFLLDVAADNRITVWVNGVNVLNNFNNWQVVNTLNITPQLNCGQNVIAVFVEETTSNASPTWFIGNLRQVPGTFPLINLNYTTDCETQTLNLFANGPQNLIYQWSGPNGFSSNQQNPVISPADDDADGTYTVTVTVPGLPCCSATLSIQVDMDTDCCEALDFQTDFTFLTGCLDIEVTDISVIPPSTIPMPITWIWGDNTPNTLSSPGATVSHTYANPGTYTVCLVVQVFPNDSTCCHDTICKEITVGTGCGDIPDPDFTVTQNVPCPWLGCCIGTNLNLNTLLTPTSVTWSWGDGSFSAGSGPSWGGWHSYSTGGSYLVTVTVIYHPPCNPKLCCVKTYQQWVRVSCLGLDDPKGDDKLLRTAMDDQATEGVEAIRIFPNPVTQGTMVTVEAPDAAPINQVILMDLAGRVVLQVPANASQRVTLEVPADLPVGVYFIRTDNQNIKPQKLVVTN